MYDFLITSFLKTTLKKLASMDSHALQIILESIKTRNSMVIKRFDYALDIMKKFVDLNAEIETDFEAFRNSFKEENLLTVAGSSKVTKNSGGDCDKFVNRIFEEFHSRKYRKLRHIRELSETTNDLLSAYSVVMFDMLRADHAKALLRDSNCKDISTASRTYLKLWSMYGSVFSVAIRISSNDLRFWLNETAYIEQALHYATIDRKKIEDYLKENNVKEYWSLEIEKPQNQVNFWNKADKK